MKVKIVTIIILTAICQISFSQNYPAFGAEKKVTIIGLTFDAMEPFISPAGNTLFFNSLNSGGNTNLYYATKINDTTFNFIGLVGGTYDPSPNHLDAVASMDSLNNFFWVSLRGYPTQMENLHRGVYSNGTVTNITRVYGDFNIYTFNFPFGWLIMDAAVNYRGDELYYCNALFDFTNTTCVGLPCEARIGIAQKVNDSTFNKLPNSDGILKNVNDTNYLIYAPQVTSDGLELYYTRLLKGSFNTEICVSVRNNFTDTFGIPMVIHSNNGFVPEAVTITSDKQKIYYHQKDNSGQYKIYLRYRTGITCINQQADMREIKIFPNPSKNILNINFYNTLEDFTLRVFTPLGHEIYKKENSLTIDISDYDSGIYFLKIEQNGKIWTSKFIKE